MKKLISIMAILTLMLLPARVMAGVNYMVITQKDGTTAVFALADKPTVGYDGKLMHITSADQTVDINSADVASFKFSENAPVGIQGVSLPGQAFLSNLKPGTLVLVSNTAGQQVATATADEIGQCHIDFNALPKGVYAVSTPNATIKVTNK